MVVKSALWEKIDYGAVVLLNGIILLSNVSLIEWNVIDNANLDNVVVNFPAKNVKVMDRKLC